MKSLKVLGFLLTYPTDNHKTYAKENLRILKDEGVLSSENVTTLKTLLDWIELTDLLDVQEEYVSLFDRTPSLSLHMFEHVHGDSRDRGQAMVDLNDLYVSKGMELSCHETPDYLPMFLEYLSTLEIDEIKKDLLDVSHVLSALEKRLENRDSLYKAVFKSIVSIVDEKVDEKKLKEVLDKSQGDAYSFEELDKEWEEQFAFENSAQTTSQGGCPKAEDMLARMGINDIRKGM
ncbi:MAG: nitrate reductase molybdenum cofactor assembly chaperone [Magnetococcales bacterium]|nr:nitrate reductase molybdenum cofactor assembly chaperone [Magnetococcales bacterium]